MASTGMLTGNALTVKLWSQKGFVDMMKRAWFGHMARRGTIMRAEELDRAQAGDDTTFSFAGILTGQGIGEGGTLNGNEEALDLQSFSMVYNVFRHAVSSPNEDTIEQARTLVKFEATARKLLPDFHRARTDSSVFNQLAGVNTTTITVDGGTVYTGTNRTFVQGLNSITAPTTNRIIRAAGAATDQAITSSDTITLDLIDAAVETLLNTYPYAGALDGEEFDLYISHSQATDLKRDSSGKIQWYANYLAVTEGGNADNPIFKGSQYGMKPVGKYANVNIYECSRIATGQNSSTAAAITTVRRAVLCGKDALSFASKFSGALTGDETEGGNAPFKYSTQLKDYDYVKGIEARMIYGVKKVVFDGEDYGSVVISTYAAAHTS